MLIPALESSKELESWADAPASALVAKFGAPVWARGYPVLPLFGVNKPIWKYDPETHGALGAPQLTSAWESLETLTVRQEDGVLVLRIMAFRRSVRAGVGPRSGLADSARGGRRRRPRNRFQESADPDGAQARDAQSLIAAAMKRSLQTREAELDLARGLDE